jgi:hypothetical protein
MRSGLVALGSGTRSRFVWIAALALLASCGGSVVRAAPSMVAPPTEPWTSPRRTASVEAAAGQAAPSPEPPTEAPTWTQIFERHLAAGAPGGCARSQACHSSEMADEGSAYSWLHQRGYIDGARSALVRPNSCLRWFGGNMPPRGADDPGAVPDLSAWVAAGAPDN